MGSYFMMHEGKRLGPMAPPEMVQAGMTRSTMVWQEGMEGYVTANAIQELREVEGGLPPDLPGAAPSEPPPRASARRGSPDAPPYSQKEFSPGSILLPVIGWPVCLTIAYIGAQSRMGDDISGPFFLAACALLVWQAVLFLKVIYRGWSVIQGPDSRTSPTNAVAFLFIPVFNLYWAFVAIHGLARELNAYLRDVSVHGGSKGARALLGIGEAAPAPSGPLSAALKEQFLSAAKDPLFRLRANVWSRVTGRGAIKWDEFMSRLGSAEFREYASVREALKSVGYADRAASGEWIFGAARGLRQVPLAGRSAVHHELFHALQDLQYGLFSRTGGSAAARLTRAATAETAAHLVGGPFIGVPVYGGGGYVIWKAVDQGE
jgi:hypothetical protein